MSNLIANLPLFFQDINEDDNTYIDRLYRIFLQDFVFDRTMICGRFVGVEKTEVDGKRERFWHLITEGPIQRRQLDYWRCQRMPWIRILIDLHQDKSVMVWENQRGRYNNICIFSREAKLFVLIRKYKDYGLLHTAYPVFEKHREGKLVEEYQKWYGRTT